MNIPMLLSQITQGIFAFFCTHAAGLAGKFQHLVLIMLVSEPRQTFLMERLILEAPQPPGAMCCCFCPPART